VTRGVSPRNGGQGARLVLRANRQAITCPTIMGRHGPTRIVLIMPRRRVVIDHVSVGVSDLARSRDFYRHALTPLGFAEVGPWRDGAEEVAFGLEEADDFAISTAYGTGAPVHVAFAADRREQVDAFYSAALEAGGRDNGAPGPRPEYSDGYYGAFVLDPDGHNIEAVHHGR
jgi:catechol 2,3-dioxygenase-like lactoylglutathione lyase family enzyme